MHQNLLYAIIYIEMFVYILYYFSDPTHDEEDPLLQIKWDPVENKDKLNYLSIGSELTKGRNPFRDRMAFWEKLHEEHTFLRVLVYFNDIGVSW